MNRSLIASPGLLVLFATLASDGIAAEPDLVLVLKGDCPLLLTAPHGGNLVVPGVGIRQGENVSQFTTVRDMRTDNLTEKIASELQRQGYGKPYVVVARFNRKFIDANRPADGAYEDDAARRHYVAYHDAIKRARQAITERWGRGVLLDIHGTSAEPSTIYRGTQDGDTSAHLTNRFGDEALRGTSGLFGQFASNGFTVDPPVESTQKESRRHRGGYTVRTYGSDDGGTFDAIQLELGAKLRATSTLDDTASRIASSIIAFASTYLPPTQERQQNEEETAKVGVLVPAYSYPAGDGLEFWNQLIKSASRIPIALIANPNSGPGRTADANYVKAIERSQAAGIRVIGYVPTGYGKRELGKVKQDVQRWKTHYPAIEGIFFDEQSSDARDVKYYINISDHTRSVIANALVVSNPGTACDEAYFDGKAADVVSVFENSKGYDAFVAPALRDEVKSVRFAGLLHSQANPATALSSVRQAAKKNLSYVFVTSDKMPNPWDQLPTYWASEVDAIEQMNVGQN